MPQGLQCFDSSGVITFDTSQKVSQILGNYTATPNNNKIEDFRLSEGQGWVLVTGISVSNSGEDGIDYYSNFPVFSINSNSISWEYSKAYYPWNSKNVFVNVDFIYGIV